MADSLNVMQCDLTDKQMDYRLLKLEICRLQQRLTAIEPTNDERRASRARMLAAMSAVVDASDCGQNMMPEY